MQFNIRKIAKERDGKSSRVYMGIYRWRENGEDGIRRMG